MSRISFKQWLGAGVLGLLLAPAGSLLAQGQGPAVIAGRVISDLQEPAAGVVVLIVELNLAATVGANGNYTITVPGERVRGQAVTVRARGIGYRLVTQQLTLSPGTHDVNFTLATDIHLLEAVVVTGVSAGTEQVKVPFAVSRLDASQLQVPAVNPLSQIQGKVPGANIVSHSGRPGATPALLLRGPTSMNAEGRSQDPLFIVDGTIIRGGLPEINPLDIESIEIVKGAAASSIYGAQAGNGVIQITTKTGRGTSEGVRFHVRSEVGASDVERDFGIARRHALVLDETGRRFCQAVSGEPMCARTFDYLETQAAVNNTPGINLPPTPQFPIDPGSGFAIPQLLRQRFQVDKWPHTTYNAVDVAVQPSPFQQHSVDMTGRLGSTSFFASASLLDQSGAIRFLEGYQRQSVRLNVDQQIGDQWQVGLRTYYAHAESDGFDQEGGGQSFFRLTRAPAVVNPLARDTLGRLFVRTNIQSGGNQNENPLYILENQQRTDIDDRILGGLDVRFQPLNWLEMSGNFNFDVRRGRGEQFRDKGFRDNFNRPSVQNGFVFQYSNGTDAINTSLNVTTQHRVGDLVIRPNARYFYEQEEDEEKDFQGNFLAVQGVRDATNVSQNQIIDSEFENTKQVSWAGGLNLDFKDRYILDGVVRRDGSSRFGAANRWDTYGRLSGTWRIAEEPWWPVEPVSEFKVRGSYGTAGNTPRFRAQYETFEIGAGGIVSFGTLGNRNLRPEKIYEAEVGADIELFGRILLGVTYANTRIEDQILPVPVPAATGFDNQWQNIGTLENKTWELSLDVPVVRSRDFSWSYKFIYDRTRSVVKELFVPPFNFGGNLQATGTIFRLEEGVPFGTFFGRAYLRDCADLPSGFRNQCGPNGAFQINDEGFVVWVGQGNTWRQGITKNLWEAELPADQAPYGFLLRWGMPIIMRDSVGGPASNVPVGNALPDFRFAITQDVTWKRLTVYALLDAAIGQDVWNQGFHWAHLDFISKDVDQQEKNVETAKPVGYYWRAGAPDATGIGGLYDLLAPNNFTVEDASYAKLRELLVSYHVGSIRGIGDWSVSVVGRNLFTITDYRGFDPEVGITGGEANTAALTAVDAFTFPNTRSFTFGVSTTF